MLTREQTELIGTIRSAFDKLERSMSGVDGEDWKVGDTIEIVALDSFHGFEIGEIVTIDLIDDSDDYLPYRCGNDRTDGWYIAKSEGRKVASGKVS